MPAEFFNTAEIALNSPAQSWGNLGLWRDSEDYSEACRRLALALGDSAELDSESHVLDAGFGCGDQLQLWIEHFNIASLQGIKLSQSQTRNAIDLLQRSGHAQHCKYLLQGDINQPDLWPAKGAHPPNRILCLDSAYHFPDRAAFLARAGDVLPKGGGICLSDFILSAPSRPVPQQLSLRSMLWCSRIPWRNLATAAQYVEQLQGAGFGSAQIEDISAEVMEGFAHWWQRFRDQVGQLPAKSRLKYAVTARFLNWAYRENVLRYIIISAAR